jgi:hypothetical protein
MAEFGGSSGSDRLMPVPCPAPPSCASPGCSQIAAVDRRISAQDGTAWRESAFWFQLTKGDLPRFLRGHRMKVASFVINVGFGLGVALGAVALLLL